MKIRTPGHSRILDPVLTSVGVFGLMIAIGLCVWQMPGLVTAPLTTSEIDGYLHTIALQSQMPPTEKDEQLDRLRQWASSDDGKPVLMLNLMRYHETVPPGQNSMGIDMSPEQMNAQYETLIRPLILKRGAYPLLGGQAHGGSLKFPSSSDRSWDRVVVVRQPSRRAFLELLSDPEYARIEPLKRTSLDVLLVPFEPEVYIPDMRMLGGALLMILFLGVGWWRS